MILQVETYDRGGSYAAIVCPVGELLSAGAVGGGTSERSAISEAINAYFNRETKLTLSEPDVAPHSQPLQGFKTLDCGPLRRRAEYGPNIRILLDEAIASFPTMKLSLTYTNSDGAQTVRDILPMRIEERRARSGFTEPYLGAIDCDKDEPRTFRLDRIDLVESV